MLRGNKFRGRATCCGQQVACCPKNVARPRNNFVDGNKQHVACCARVAVELRRNVGCEKTKNIGHNDAVIRR